MTDFLINANMCILNGRNFISNDFTSISSKGCSVVDYCLVSYDQLISFEKFTVIRAAELINRSGHVSVLAPSGIPDHSALSWRIHVDIAVDSPDLSVPQIEFFWINLM